MTPNKHTLRTELDQNQLLHFPYTPEWVALLSVHVTQDFHLVLKAAILLLL